MLVVNSKKNGQVLIISLNGRLDSSTAGEFESKITSAIDNDKDYKIIVNFDDLDYISSAGLRVLLMAAKKTGAKGGKVIITGMKDHIKEVFDISGFSSIFTMFKTDDEALKSF